MDYISFEQKFRQSLPVGTVLSNPGGGTSEVLRYGNESVTYNRGKSNILVSLRALHFACEHFWGQRMTSSDLRLNFPSKFDSKFGGHSCNCTFLFMALQQMGLVSKICGNGKKGAPYYVDLPSVKNVTNKDII